MTVIFSMKLEKIIQKMNTRKLIAILQTTGLTECITEVFGCFVLSLVLPDSVEIYLT